MSAIDVLLDTNIVIYALNGRERYMRAMQGLGVLGMSVISYMEVLLGARDIHEEHAAVELMLNIEVVPFDSAMAFDVSQSLRRRGQKSLRSPLFPDTAIAHTALSLGVPLVTSNRKDFEAFKDLELVVP